MCIETITLKNNLNENFTVTLRYICSDVLSVEVLRENRVFISKNSDPKNRSEKDDNSLADNSPLNVALKFEEVVEFINDNTHYTGDEIQDSIVALFT
ncbi:hypothetical protein [Paenibacillus sp. AGC30]